MTDSISISFSIRSLRDWWFALPPDLSPPERRTYTVAAAVGPLTWSIHVFYIFLFAYWRVWPLVILTIFSVILWTGTLYLVRQRRLTFAYALAAVEVIIHQTVVILFLGWGFGAQYFLMSAGVTVFLFSRWPRWTSFSLTALYALLFILYYYYTQIFPPLVSVPPVQLAIMNIINIASTFALMAVASLYFISVAEHAEAALEVEHARSEALLNNVMPTSIAARLKQDSTTIADGFQNASILFADIVDFTSWSLQFSPNQMVNTLDTIFSRFDELVDEYGLEKIKTIGDAYMVASGIPRPRADHAVVLACFSLAMRDAMVDCNRLIGTDLQLRIGLSSGPVVAGVIGKRRFLYDLWGDSVNTASRMESQGQAGEIQISEATRQLLDDRFTLIDRGVIDVKGKGSMQTYFLRGMINNQND